VTGAERGAGGGGRGRRNRIGRHPLTSLGKRRIAHVWHSIKRKRRAGDLGVKCRGCLINGGRTYKGAGGTGVRPVAFIAPDFAGEARAMRFTS